MAKKRSRTDIIYDMLIAIQRKGGYIKPTHLMYKANLSHKQMNLYLDELMERSVIEKVKDKKNEYITITEKGTHFLNKIREMREFDTAFGI
ncbi:MAG: winged helix-turn-helix domain-containing protein [Candidatus Woesearchaeota archaeon]